LISVSVPAFAEFATFLKRITARHGTKRPLKFDGLAAWFPGPAASVSIASLGLRADRGSNAVPLVGAICLQSVLCDPRRPAAGSASRRRGVRGVLSLLLANLIKITEGLTGLRCVEATSCVPNLAPRCRLKWRRCRRWHRFRECPSFHFLHELGSERWQSVWSVSVLAAGLRRSEPKYERNTLAEASAGM
jgi:hypothetical protein